MPQSTTSPSAARATLPESSDWGAAFLLSPWLWGPALAIGFYQALPHIPISPDFKQRYFCSHWTLYAEMGSFFLGMSILARKAIGLLGESRALRWPLFEQAAADEPASAVERAERLWNALAAAPAGLRRSKFFERVCEVCDYVQKRGTSQALDEHLRYRADLAADGLSASYALVRTITWAIPILGFLGTVIGITMAIANISGDQLSSSLTEVTAGLAVAFDTTALALTLSIFLVFATFLIERGENSVLSRVEQLGITELAPSFPVEGGAATAPLAAAEAQAADLLLRRTEELITWQTGMWQSALENLRGRWLETADKQQLQFSQALQQGMSATLSGHERQMAESRNELLSGFRAAAGELGRVADEVREAAARQQNSFAEQIASLWRQLQDQLVQTHEDQAAQSASHVKLLAEAIGGWHRDLEASTLAVRDQLVELQKQGEILKGITAQEAELTRLQATLQNNLQSLRAVEAFDESIHSLNAAVHMLTARARAHAA